MGGPAQSWGRSAAHVGCRAVRAMPRDDEWKVTGNKGCCCGVLLWVSPVQKAVQRRRPWPTAVAYQRHDLCQVRRSRRTGMSAAAAEPWSSCRDIAVAQPVVVPAVRNRPCRGAIAAAAADSQAAVTVAAAAVQVHHRQTTVTSRQQPSAKIRTPFAE